MWLERCLVVGAFHIAVEGEMLLYHLRAHSHGGYRPLYAAGVVAISHLGAESGGYGVHGSQIYIGKGCGILRIAVKQCYLVAREASGFEHSQCVGYLLHFAHPGRHYHRAVLRGYLAQIRQIGDFARWNLPIVHIEFFEYVDRHEVEGGAHKTYTLLLAYCGKFHIIGERKVYSAAHIELTFIGSGGFFLILGLGGEGRNHEFGHGGLKFHIVGSGTLGFVYHFHCQVVVAVVIYAGFGYYYHFVTVAHCWWYR